ncbi:hypothetical protein VTL71DRAFT_1944 [Oculimacula yallundae]|uniref:Uncharacterized protein n=1 Tax=Oculimacula yallundae TaxID=86028 RepID=A0ABR4CED8_9HELO
MLFLFWQLVARPAFQEHPGIPYKLVAKFAEAEKDIANAKLISKKWELESSLSYPHEHTKERAKSCKLRYGNIFVVFREHRASPFPPRSARKVKKERPGKDIDETSDDEQKTGMNCDKKANKEPYEDAHEDELDEALEEEPADLTGCTDDSHRTESGTFETQRLKANLAGLQHQKPRRNPINQRLKAQGHKRRNRGRSGDVYNMDQSREYPLAWCSNCCIRIIKTKIPPVESPCHHCMKK